MRRRTSIGTRAAIAAAAVLTLTPVAVLTLSGGALARPEAGAARVATVRIAHTSAGGLLVAANGHTIYQLSRDGRNHDMCIKISGCAAVWPPLTVKGTPSAGSGAKSSLLGTINIGHGRRQVTYAGHPLYTYTGDSGPAATDYLGFNAGYGMWYGVSSSGKRIS